MQTTYQADAFLASLTESIKTYRYFVDWHKTEQLRREHDLHLHMMNYLIGKKNVKEELHYLIKREPSIVQVFPILIAVRDQRVAVYDSSSSKEKERAYLFQQTSIQSENDIEAVISFLEKTGIVALIEEQKIRSFSDYVFGIEVGLDTHARKNRAGDLMEQLVDGYLMDTPEIFYIKQASHQKIEKNFGIQLHPSLQRRIFDFVVRKNGKLTFIETNFFNDGGTKLKSVVGEFKQLQQDFHTYHPEHQLLWVTDGKGWMKTKQPLHDAFQQMDTILNLSMLENGAFREVF